LSLNCSKLLVACQKFALLYEMFVDNESAFVEQERHGSAGAHLASAKTPCVYDLEHISVRFSGGNII
jgi:hypothetical protein